MYRHQIYQEDVERIANSELDWEQFENKRVAVTGAIGMTASMLIDVLMYRNRNMGANVSIIAVTRSKDRIIRRFSDYLDDSQFSYVIQNLKNLTPDMGKVDIVFHASGYTLPDAFETDPIGTVSLNVIGIHKLLSYASTHRTQKIVFFSSVDIYGTNRGDTGRFTEDYCGYLNCNSTEAGFAESRRVGESLCCAYANQYGMDVSIARLCKIYGPSMSLEDSKAIARYLKQAIRGEDVVLTGNREEIYSYCYVADAVAAVLTIAMKGKDGEAYNIADNRETLNAKLLAEKIAAMVSVSVVEDSGVVKPFETGRSYANNYLMDAGKLMKLGWKPEVDMTEGLRRTLQVFSELGING